jgi:cobalt-zinc-cadmium efflux system outer membrane protein
MNRYDLRLAENNLLYNEQNYALQKALRVPDLTLGAQFDKRGSFVNNASFISAAIDLPFFNHNQGNIKAAKINIDQSHTNLDLQKFIVENDVQKAYSKAINTEKMLQSFDPQFRSQFERLLKGVTDNFQKKNISLIEFTDFYESYKENILQVNQLQYQRMQAIEDLNFAVGKNLYQ